MTLFRKLKDGTISSPVPILGTHRRWWRPADIQVARVAKARHVSPDQIRAIVAEYRSARTLGIFGEPTVNVLQLNLQLDHMYPVSS